MIFLIGSVVNRESITITGESIVPGRNYWCYLVMNYNRGNSGNRTSAQSQSILVTTRERKSMILFLYLSDQT